MDVMKLLLVTVVLMLVTVIIGFSLSGYAEPFATPHPDFPSMAKSNGQHALRLDVVGMGFATGLLIVVFMTCAVLQSLKKNGSFGQEWRWVITGFIIYAMIIFGMVISYLHSSPEEYFGGFPLATAWFVYPFYVFPFVLVVFYVIRFDQWIFNKADKQQFENLVQERRGNEP